MTQSAPGDPFSPAARPNGYPLDAHLPAASGFIASPFQRQRSLITHYDDAERALRDPRLVQAGPSAIFRPKSGRSGRMNLIDDYAFP